MSDPSNKARSIPPWQQNADSEKESQSTEHQHAVEPATQLSHAELLDQARDFLKDESIRDASRERKVGFLQKKGLQASDIEQLLDEKTATTAAEQSEELKTIHDSNTGNITTEIQASTSPPHSISEDLSAQPSRPSPQQQPQRDIPPIITYPEFLLKPQKPPPLITIPRLINATYAFVGLATLTYGANKYILEPMLDALTESRHSLATTTLADLEKFNDKLETCVSHVPYTASAAALRKSHNGLHEDDADSITSDPTELFHRDIATQTTPNLSRKNSLMEEKDKHLDLTTQQVMRLSSLHDTLSSLTASLDPAELSYLPPPASKKLHSTLADFQAVIDKLETTYNPLRGDYYSLYAQPADNKKATKDNDMAAKVRAEIRNLKGALLSARNFPTAPRPPVNSYVSR